MKQKEQAKVVRSLSSSDYVNLFIANLGRDIRYKSSIVQIYDYRQLSERMKLPTTIFRPNYNYVLLLQDGNITMQFGAEIKQIYAPATLFVTAGHIISVRAISDDISGTFVVLENESLNRIFSEQELLKILQIPKVISLNQEDNSIINGIGRLLLDEYKSEMPELQVLIALVQALLHKLLKHAGINDVLSRNHMIAIKFKELVYKNFTAHKNVSFYTGTLDVSENYLNRCVRLIFNKSAKRFILEVAIMQSQFLLQDMQKGIAEVAYELNFEDSSYFSRIFRKITGLTPTAYKFQVSSNQQQCII